MVVSIRIRLGKGKSLMWGTGCRQWKGSRALGLLKSLCLWAAPCNPAPSVLQSCPGPFLSLLNMYVVTISLNEEVTWEQQMGKKS